MLLTFDHGPIRELRFNRPPVHALTREFLSALREAVEAASSAGFRAIVLSGTPGRFSAGLDVPLLLTLDRPAIAELWRELYGVFRALACSSIPVVAAITGHATAGGIVLPIFCDWRVAAQGDFKIGVNEVQVGIPLPPVIIAAMRRLIGPRETERLAVSGALISPEEAARVGLVDELAQPDQVIDRALQWCHGRLALPANAMAVTRQVSRADLVALFDSLDDELTRVTAAWWTPESQSTLRAVVERLQKKKSS